MRISICLANGPQKIGGLENVSEEIELNDFNRLNRYWSGQFGIIRTINEKQLRRHLE
jgi:hypothetical protein